MTRRLGVICALGLLLTATAGAFALTGRKAERPARNWPSNVVARVSTLELVDTGRCFVVHGIPAAPVCRIDRPLVVFRKGRQLVGLASLHVAALVSGSYAIPRFPVRGGFAFDVELTGPFVISARDSRGRVLARLYCASALRGVCGISAQRRS